MDGLIFANMNEDYRAELHVLQKGCRKTFCSVLCIASSGDTALSLLSCPEVSYVDAVDTSAASRRLCTFKQHALCKMDGPEKMRLLMGQATSHEQRRRDVAARLALYEAEIRHCLPTEEDKDYWKGMRTSALTYGLMHCGARERFLTRARREWLGEEIGTLAWKRRAIHSLRLENVMGSHTVLPLQASSYSAEAVVESLSNAWQGSDSYFAHLYVTGLFPSSGCCPAYLSDTGHAAALRAGGYGPNRLQFHHSDIFNFSPSLTYDLISLSNVVDWWPGTDEELANALHRMRSKLLSPQEEGAKGILIRSAVGGLYDRLHRMGFGGSFSVEESQELMEVESSLYFGRYAAHKHSGVIALVR